MYIYIYLTDFYLERGMFTTKVVEKINTHILHSAILLPKVVPFMR